MSRLKKTLGTSESVGSVPNGNRNSARDPYAALRVWEFRRFFAGSVIGITGQQIQTVAVGWELYERTNSALALGGVGLVQVVPVLLLALFAGHVADRYDRRRVLMMMEAVLACAALGLAFASLHSDGSGGVIGIYACLFLSGVARAFQGPARTSLLPRLVPRELFPNAVTWNSGGFQLASVIGPALGGLIIATTHRVVFAYIANACAALTFLLLVNSARPRVDEANPKAQDGASPALAPRSMTMETLAAGFRFVWGTKIILAAITLDLFAVLLGGAVTLLPIYAKDILHVGAAGLGWLRAAPAIGAVAMTLLLAHLPPFRKSGRTLLLAVAGFGVATIIFGLSRSFALSLVMLLALGALDQISVVIRSTLVQLMTPDEMRGRVAAVNGMFISTSNELGGFESGAAAAVFGTVAAVVSGGVGTLLVVIAVAFIFPALRSYGALISQRTHT